MVCDLLAKSATAELTEEDTNAIDHYLGITGIDQWVLDVTKQKENEHRRLRKQREEADQQKRNQEALHRKINSDRLAKIQVGLQSAAVSTLIPYASCSGYSTRSRVHPGFAERVISDK